MNTQLMLLPLEHLVDSLTVESIRLARSIHSNRTLSGYACDWRIFSDWCVAAGREILPATAYTVKLYVTDMLCRQRKINTARRHICAIVHYHRVAGYESPCTPDVYAVLTGAQRLRLEQPRQKAAISVEQLARMIRLVDRPEPFRSRDRAILLFGFATALRRSTIIDLKLNDLEYTEHGVIVQIRHEKQDQEGVGRTIGIPFGRNAETCPVRAVMDWIERRGKEPGPIFCGMSHDEIEPAKSMDPNTVAVIVKRAAQSIGLDSADYGGHSLRAGFVTASLEAGVGEILTARHTGHRSLTTLRRYMRSQDPFRGNACAALGL